MELNYSAQKKKKLSAPKPAKNFFSIDVGQMFFEPLYYGRSFAFGGNSGPVPGRKVSFFEHCSATKPVHKHRWTDRQTLLHILSACCRASNKPKCDAISSSKDIRKIHHVIKYMFITFPC